MKAILTLATLLTSLTTFSHNSQITCQFENGGYDDEFIVLNLKENKVESLEYTSFMGEVGPFEKYDMNRFEHTTDQLVISYLVSVSNDLKTTTLDIVYKSNQQRLGTQVFQCN